MSIFACNKLYAQEVNYDSLMVQEVENVNAVYMPVIGFGAGLLNYYGNVNNNIRNTMTGNPGYKVNITTYLDSKNRFFTANLYGIFLASFSGNQRSSSDLQLNRNFKTDITDFGANVSYDFGHFFNKRVKVKPFVSLGFEMVLFNSKTDMKLDGTNTSYYYWPDGTIRNIQWYPGIINQGTILNPDFKYETNINAPQYVLAVPLEVGLTFKASDRLSVKLSSSLHYTFSNAIDGVKGKSNDMFTFNSISLNFDLFSSKRTIKLEKLYEDINDFDYTMLLDDEDNDMVPDRKDMCPHTPLGVPVDTVGCPFDSDGDGVPDYKDKQPNSPKNAVVDDNGVQINPDDWGQFFSNPAINRSEVAAYIANSYGFSKYSGTSHLEIPRKFKSVDKNGDGYISYDELLKGINDFFDFKSDLTTKDIYELTEFFFSQ